MYGKLGFNPANQKRSEIIYSQQELWDLATGPYDRCDFNIINEHIAFASYSDMDEYTQHDRSCVYIATFVTAYARDKLFAEGLEPLGENVLYFDTDSVIYVSPYGNHLIGNDASGDLGTWANQLENPDDYFTEFVSAGPKTYALKSHSGKEDICKAKGFCLSYKNAEIMNFDTLRERVLHKAMGGTFKHSETVEDEESMEKLMLDEGDNIFRRKDFHISVEKNPGKVLNMVYDKRHIVVPKEPHPKCIDTLPLGHYLI
jgi:hypothetical protein